MDNRKLKIGSLATGLGLVTLPFGGWIPAAIAAGVGVMVGNQQFPAGEKPWRDLHELLNEGEHGRLEFKANLSNGKKSPFDGIVKTIAAFANTDGGELIIGITDDGEITGLEPLIQKYKKTDRLECSVRDAIRNNIDTGIDRLYRLKFEDYEDHLLCRVEVTKSRKHVFLNDGSFYIRDGNRTIALSPREYNKLKSDEEL